MNSLRTIWVSAAFLLLLHANPAPAQHQIVCSGEAAGGYAAFPMFVACATVLQFVDLLSILQPTKGPTMNDQNIESSNLVSAVTGGSCFITASILWVGLLVADAFGKGMEATTWLTLVWVILFSAVGGAAMGRIRRARRRQV